MQKFLLCYIPLVALTACSKKNEKIQIKVSIDDAKTAKVYRDTANFNKNNLKSAKDVISQSDSNKNGAKLSSVKVSYTDENGKK